MVFVLLAIINPVFAIIAAAMASGRGRRGPLWFLIGCFIGVIAIFIVRALPEKELPKNKTGDATPRGTE